MNLADALKATETKHARPCPMDAWLSTLSDDDRAAAVTALADKNRSTRAIHEVFAAYGFHGSQNIIWNHRTPDRCKKCGTLA